MLCRSFCLCRELGVKDVIDRCLTDKTRALNGCFCSDHYALERDFNLDQILVIFLYRTFIFS